MKRAYRNGFSTDPCGTLVFRVRVEDEGINQSIKSIIGSKIRLQKTGAKTPECFAKLDGATVYYQDENFLGPDM